MKQKVIIYHTEGMKSHLVIKDDGTPFGCGTVGKFPSRDDALKAITSNGWQLMTYTEAQTKKYLDAEFDALANCRI